MLNLLLASFFACIYFANGTYYVGIEASATWQQAEERCRTGVYIKATGGKLATWDSYNQYNNDIKSAFNLLSGTAWVGLTDLNGWNGGEGDWHFIDGRDCGGTCLPKSSVPNGLDEWSPNEPNDLNDEDCAEIWTGAGDRRGNPNGLNDAGCNNGRNYICQFDNLINPTGPGKEFLSGPVSIDNPFDLDDPSGNHNYYIMEFSSGKDIIFFASVILNVVLIAMVCYLGAKGCKGPTPYSKVDVDYSIEDEKL